ncbi:MAG TPA: serine/threonine-protein kinase, partial [Polyangia bacterium]|nr:serine/threonine-protein kinase [Polyangia bacterium]
MSGANTTHSCAHCGAEFPEDGLFCPMCGTPRPQARGPASADTLIGQIVGDRYLLHERIGEGGSGVIYRGEHVTLRRPVAIKFLHHKLSRDDLAIERFRREATTVAEIDNDHVVKVFDFGRSSDGRLFFAMELLDGDTLGRVIERERTLPIVRLVDILTQLGEALMEAHAMGYVHRDLRPANVFLITRKGRHDFVKLLDFGLSKLLTPEGEAAQTSLGMTFGDPRYMSPEQARGQTLDRRSDIYALGIIGYEMLCGKPPFGGQKTLDVLQKHLEVIPTPPSAVRKDVPPWLEAVVLRALSKRPDDRFVTVMRMIEAIREGPSKTASPAVLAASFGPTSGLQAPTEPPFRDTIPDPEPPKFGHTLMLPSSGRSEPAPPPAAPAPPTGPHPEPPDAEPLPEPVSMSQVPTVNAQPTADRASIVSSSQKWFQAGDAAPYEEGDRAEVARAASGRSSARRAAAAEADDWDEAPVSSGPPRAVKITIGVLAVVLAAMGVWMLWPRAKPLAQKTASPTLASAPAPASTQPDAAA